MKKLFFVMLLFMSSFFLTAQQYMVFYNQANVLVEKEVNLVDSVKFISDVVVIHLQGENSIEIPVSEIDSIIFSYQPVNQNGTIVYIMYLNDHVSVINPLSAAGITVTATTPSVVVTSTSDVPNIEYHISGHTVNGSLTMNSAQPVKMTLSHLKLTNLAGAAITISQNVPSIINIAGLDTTFLADGSSSSKNAPLLSNGELIFQGNGMLYITGVKKHGISCSDAITVNSGKIFIASAANDGLHCEGFLMNAGNITVQNTVGDGIDAGGETVVVNGGTIHITSTSADVKGIKGDENMTINGGTINMTVSGAQSKGLSSKQNIIFNGGNITITTSGAVVLETSGNGVDPSYCTAVKSSKNIIFNDGNLQINSTSSSQGGKGLSADGNIQIYGGILNITTAGNGATFTNSSGLIDSYTAACIKSDAHIELLGGQITCHSAGTGGKGISADSTLKIGNFGVDNSLLNLTVGTSGAHFLVSGSGMNADYANPKAVKSTGNLTVNSGTITINCTQTTEGGEGLESKDTLSINGGNIDIHTFDDCINAAHHIAINAGNIYCVSSGNDGIDCNGTLSIGGGFTIANGTRAPEEGFDCDNNTFKITGGTAIGTGGATSNPTSSACTQKVLKFNNVTPGQAVCIKNANNEMILLYTLPVYTGTGGGGSGGGNSMVLLFTDPLIANGSYTFIYGGTISGGTTVNGYNTGGTYSGGTTKNFTVNGMVTTIN
ncbi:MAG: carbohydrate-binding domain-containing protein [Bacteroidales bacterium]|jgi:hypothetical protein|nr:carbohydrate-binding domain-containing protein [Bacteroidales bacterium]